ncbi:MAG: MBOAT family protein [Oscillospiraceae bacterium]|nr:MBOAT family protein [Oscillospiraceae bacterium]
MLFSSVEFLYFFLPVTLLVYFLIPMPGKSPKLRNYWLLLMSLVFYGWGEPRYLALMAVQMLAGWGFGLLIDLWRGKKGAKIALAGAVIVGVGSLVFFKYTNFFIVNINGFSGASIPLLKLVMPIGISFYTFQLLSYEFDLYSGSIRAQKNFFTLCTYVALFPQLIAGPIVRYADIENDLEKRSHSLDKFAGGVRRFVIGMGKKVLLANVLGEFVELAKKSGEVSVFGTWIYVIAYALHIYFDFSGYSDMAIGIGKMLGFNFPENFNYPYIASGISDFWRRWHISLSAWFRDYVYIPLGGNRVKMPRYVFNVMVVWFLTGFWHGADWNYMAWGAYFGVLLLFERFFLGKALQKLPRFVSHLYMALAICIGWMFFDSETLALAGQRIGYMFGAGADSLIGADMLYYLRSYFVPLAAAAVGCTPLPSKLAAKLAGGAAGRRVMTVLEPLAVCAALLAVTACLVDGSFNPFIYFRF